MFIANISIEVLTAYIHNGVASNPYPVQIVVECAWPTMYRDIKGLD